MQQCAGNWCISINQCWISWFLAAQETYCQSPSYAVSVHLRWWTPKCLRRNLLGRSYFSAISTVDDPSVLWLLVGQQEGLIKSWVLVCWWWWQFYRTLQVLQFHGQPPLPSSLAPNKIQNVILVLGCPEKWPLNQSVANDVAQVDCHLSVWCMVSAITLWQCHCSTLTSLADTQLMLWSSVGKCYKQ